MTANSSPTSINSLDAERTFFRDFFGIGGQPGFGVNLRKVAAEALGVAYEKETDEPRRKLLVINLHQQACLTFEDVGRSCWQLNGSFPGTWTSWKPTFSTSPVMRTSER